MKFSALAIGTALAVSGAASAADTKSYAVYAPAQEIRAYMRDGPVTKCLIKARNTYATCKAAAKTKKAEDACLKTLQKKILTCQNAK